MKKLGTRCLTIGMLVMLSCKDPGPKKRFLPPSTGGINSLMVVMDTELWNGSVGDKIREQFAKPAIGLTPEQSIFTITQIPPQVFKGATAYSRSVLFVEQDTTSRAYIKTNVYATPQKIAVIKGETYNDFAQKTDSISGIAIAAFKKVELEEAQKRFTRSLNKEKALEEEFGINLKIPSLYKLGRREKNFVWMDIQIPKGTMNILAYSMPWYSFTTDSTFVNDIVKMRDSIGQLYIPGPDVPGKTTHMITEKAFAPYVFPAQVGGKKATEVRGIWEIKGYPMAGPFLTYIINDKEHNRKLVLEGFVFAPSEKKRDYMFELEAILKTLKFELDE